MHSPRIVVGFIYVLIYTLGSHVFIQVVNAACSSCLVSSVAGSAVAGAIGSRNRSKMNFHVPTLIQNHRRSAFLYLSVNRSCTKIFHSVNMKQHLLEAASRSDADDDSGLDENIDLDEKRREKIDKMLKDSESTQSKPVTAGMVGAIGFYKNFISPLLPPACRFMPTCSQYGVQAIEEFGPEKGLILTAWRLMRCSPFGGKGYDPPKWPPVAYNHGSY